MFPEDGAHISLASSASYPSLLSSMMWMCSVKWKNNIFALTTKVEQTWDVILSLISSNAETENRGKGLPRIKVVIEDLLLE